MNDLKTQGPPWKGWRDDPIKTAAEDRLRRAPVAQRAAQLIAENHSPESSVVYGLEGPWGSGKSSVIALITTYLTESPNGDWQVVTFTPWATSGTEGLFSEFFAALSTVDPGGHKKGLRDLITSYADLARPLASLIPFVGAAAGELATTAAKRLEKPWNVAFDEIAAALRELDTPVIVVVDDIDRLQPGELLDLLKVVRLLGRFPGVDFLLAYDEQTLVETLQTPGQGTASKARARAFMEKIVQYPLTIPPLLTSQIVRMLDSGLTEILTLERVETSFDKQRFGDVILTTMPKQLATPRAIERFLAQVREQVRAHDLDEMNDVDLILATFLRVQFPDVYARLQSWKANLTKVTSSSYISVTRREEQQPNWDELVDGLEEEEDRRDALSILRAIFPVVRGKDPSRLPAGRFAHPDYFDRYLAQAIPEGDIPDALISQLLETAATGDAHDLRALLADDDNDRVLLALGKIRARYPDIDEVQYHTGPKGLVTFDLLAVAMALVDDAQDDRLTTWTSTSDQLRWWAATLLRRLLDTEPTCDIDPALLRCSQIHRRTHVLITATRDVNRLSDATQKALTDALQREVGRILPMLLTDLRKGDGADGESGSSFLYELVADSPSLAALQTQIAAGLAANDFTIEDVAARFVDLAYVIGGSGRPSSASFSGELFTKVTGTEARSANRAETGEWRETTWPRRREFAAQFITPTAAQDDGTVQQQTEDQR
ncbi:KAP-like P-loop domain-containing protein [Humibacillus xanthopallidus]|uniref:KAP-like P-loop domain-containing protein n=1 Tax=Humibacillus xanthopallidus TaxID=412689 RepID=A0A543PWX7_9MICO|nr:KAP family NTPase [Humibacillus xanthopallidus]TQN48588.1 KAP-like P-loop domain-containing protein [Humibacillus xanthopallidus]